MDYNTVIAVYDQVITLDPEYAEAYLKRGDAYYEKEDYDTA